mgnify:CR=1 FL=1
MYTLTDMIPQGQTWQGNEIYGVKISDNVANEPAFYDDPDEETYFLVSNHHSREWMTIPTVMYFIHYLTYYYEEGPIDNDGDGLIDCEDPDCFLFSTLCGESVPRIPYEESENPFAIFEQSTGNRGQNIRDGVAAYRADGNDVYHLLKVCHDFIDNDDDGQFDCGDSDCQNIKENCCSREFTDERCSDGIDNDQNGFTDCGDWTCSRGAYVTVCDETTEKTCSDGIDNDGDGLFDCRDDDCQGLPVCAEGNCTDSVDNDGDGTIDCFDSDCAGTPGCVGPEESLEACQDGLDNDGNGYIDCNDFSCSSSDDQAACEHSNAAGNCIYDGGSDMYDIGNLLVTSLMGDCTNDAHDCALGSLEYRSDFRPVPTNCFGPGGHRAGTLAWPLKAPRKAAKGGSCARAAGRSAGNPEARKRLG